MERWKDARDWIAENRDIFLDFLRIYVGFALMVKGVYFVKNAVALTETLRGSELSAQSVALSHYVAMAHVVGGLLLGIGLVTRLAALVQIPAVLGAIFFVHWQQGLFTPAGTLEFATLVLFLLVTFTVSGSGRISVDHALRRSGDVGDRPVEGEPWVSTGVPRPGR
jgi:putative oxidoreductase